MSLSFNISHAKEDYIRIPVSINPLVQLPLVDISKTARLFYNTDKEFYSNVTALDVARNAKRDLSETIKKSIEVVFLIAASSHVSKTLTRKKLAYLKQSSKWSYKIPVEQLLSESNESLNKLTDQIQIYKIQELAMKVLARKYGFSVDFVIQKHRMDLMTFYAANEEQWVKIVGTITEIVVKSRSKQLNLTPCYLAELINKTQNEMEGFTLQEVDMYLNNISALNEKLPVYQNETLRSFYEAFSLTPTHLAKMSNINISVIKAMGVRDAIQLFTRTILLKLHISKIPSGFSENTTICRSQWNLFREVMLSEAFEKQAREMSIMPATLGEIVQVPYHTIQGVSLTKMIHLIETVIRPLKEDKTKIEKYTLSMLRNLHNTRRLNTKKHNAISLIKRTTKLGKRNLKLLYGWTSPDYHFARFFTVKDLGDECSIDVKKKTLFSLSKLNIGRISKDINCTTFYALRLVWGQGSLSDLKKLNNPNTRISLDEPIAATVAKLTNSSIRISCRVLSKIPIIQWLLQKITLNNISDMTNHTDIYLQEIPIQRIILIIHELLKAGSFTSVLQVRSTQEFPWVKTNILTLLTALTHAHTLNLLTCCTHLI
jgi:hypothetical protein